MPPSTPLRRAPGPDDKPIVAFAPPSDVQSCGGPLDIVWFHSGMFEPADRLFALSISSVGHASTIPLMVTPITIVVAQSQDVLIARHAFVWPKVLLPTGFYVINGTALDGSSNADFRASPQFFVATGPDTSCLDGLNPPTAPTQTSTTYSGTTLVLPSPSGSTPAPPAGNMSETPSSTAPVDTPHAVSGSTLPIDHRTKVIAGSVAGSIIAVCLIGLLLVLCHFRRRKTVNQYQRNEPPPGWHNAHIQRINSEVRQKSPRSPPIPRAIPRPPKPAQVMVEARKGAPLVHVPEQGESGSEPSSVYLTVPPAPRVTVNGSSDSDPEQSRTTLHTTRWGWGVPITPMFNLITARRSSAGSSNFLSPGGPLETPRDQATFPLEPPAAPALAPASMRGRMDSDRATRLTGYTYDRDAVHSISDFPWAGMESPVPSTMAGKSQSFQDMQSERSAAGLDTLPEGSDTETEEEKAPPQPPPTTKKTAKR